MRVDYNEIVDLTLRLNKIDNTARVRKSLHDTDLSDAAIDAILGCINQMQDSLNEQTSKRLESYTQATDFRDLSNEQDVLLRRVLANEANVAKNGKVVADLEAQLKSSRVRVTKLQQQIDSIKKGTNSALEAV